MPIPSSAELARFVSEQIGKSVKDTGNLSFHSAVSLVPLGCVGHVVVFTDDDEELRMAPLPFSALLTLDAQTHGLNEKAA